MVDLLTFMLAGQEALMMCVSFETHHRLGWWRKGNMPPDWTMLWYRGFSVPPLITVDVACPLLPWLMKPYVGQVTKTSKSKLSTVKWMCLECAFGPLKPQWKSLNYRFKVEAENITTSIVCVLQNSGVTQGDIFSDSWAQESESEGVVISFLVDGCCILKSPFTAAHACNAFNLHCVSDAPE